MIRLIVMLTKSVEGWILLTAVAVMMATAALLIALIEASMYDGEDEIHVGD